MVPTVGCVQLNEVLQLPVPSSLVLIEALEGQVTEGGGSTVTVTLAVVNPVVLTQPVTGSVMLTRS